MRAPVADTDSVAVRRRVRHSANTDRAPGAGHILDQDWLAERDAHTIAHHARHGVRRAAGRKRNVERDRTCRIALCSGGAWYRRQRGSARDQMQKLSTLKLHLSPPIVTKLHHAWSVRKELWRLPRESCSRHRHGFMQPTEASRGATPQIALVGDRWDRNIGLGAEPAIGSSGEIHRRCQSSPILAAGSTCWLCAPHALRTI